MIMSEFTSDKRQRHRDRILRQKSKKRLAALERAGMANEVNSHIQIMPRSTEIEDYEGYDDRTPVFRNPSYQFERVDHSYSHKSSASTSQATFADMAKAGFTPEQQVRSKARNDEMTLSLGHREGTPGLVALKSTRGKTLDFMPRGSNQMAQNFGMETHNRFAPLMPLSTQTANYNVTAPRSVTPKRYRPADSSEDYTNVSSQVTSHRDSITEYSTGSYDTFQDTREGTHPVTALYQHMEVVRNIFGRLPGPNYLTQNMGNFDGELIFIERPNGNVDAYQWSMQAYQWVEIGTYSYKKQRIEGSLSTERLRGSKSGEVIPPGTLKYFRAAAIQREQSTRSRARAHVPVDHHIATATPKRTTYDLEITSPHEVYGSYQKTAVKHPVAAPTRASPSTSSFESQYPVLPPRGRSSGPENSASMFSSPAYKKSSTSPKPIGSRMQPKRDHVNQGRMLYEYADLETHVDHGNVECGGWEPSLPAPWTFEDSTTHQRSLGSGELDYVHLSKHARGERSLTITNDSESESRALDILGVETPDRAKGRTVLHDPKKGTGSTGQHQRVAQRPAVAIPYSVKRLEQPRTGWSPMDFPAQRLTLSQKSVMRNDIPSFGEERSLADNNELSAWWTGFDLARRRQHVLDNLIPGSSVRISSNHDGMLFTLCEVLTSYTTPHPENEVRMLNPFKQPKASQLDRGWNGSHSFWTSPPFKTPSRTTRKGLKETSSANQSGFLTPSPSIAETRSLLQQLVIDSTAETT